MDKYPLTAIFINKNKRSFNDFQNLVKNSRYINKIFTWKTFWFQTARIFVNWANSQDKATLEDVDVIYFDPESFGHSVNSINVSIAAVKALGYHDDQIVALVSSSDSETVTDALRRVLGSHNVQADAQAHGIINAATNVATYKTDSSGRGLQFDILKLNATLDVISDRINSLESRLAIGSQSEIDDIKNSIWIIQRTLFQQDAETQTPSIITRLLESERLSASLENDISRLSESIKKRLGVYDTRIKTIEKTKDDLNSAKTLRRIDFNYKLLTVAASIIIIGIFDRVFHLPLGDILQTILSFFGT